MPFSCQHPRFHPIHPRILIIVTATTRTPSVKCDGFGFISNSSVTHTINLRKLYYCSNSELYIKWYRMILPEGRNTERMKKKRENKWRKRICKQTQKVEKRVGKKYINCLACNPNLMVTFRIHFRLKLKACSTLAFASQSIRKWNFSLLDGIECTVKMKMKNSFESFFWLVHPWWINNGKFLLPSNSFSLILQRMREKSWRWDLLSDRPQTYTAFSNSRRCCLRNKGRFKCALYTILNDSRKEHRHH